MVIGFVIWSMVAALFFGIGISCYKSNDTVGFFTFVKPPEVKDVKGYNKAVARLWFVSAVIMEMMGVPILFLKQNSPLTVVIIFEVMILVIGMMIVYLKIEAKYRK